MTIKDQLYGRSGAGEPPRPGSAGATNTTNLSGPVSIPGISAGSGYAQGDLAGLISDPLLRLLHRKLIVGRERRPGEGLAEPEASLRRRIGELLNALPADPELAAVPNHAAQLAAVAGAREAVT